MAAQASTRLLSFLADKEFEEEFKVDFDMAAKEITNIYIIFNTFNCSLCRKKYKTANGLARHNFSSSHKQ